MQYQEDAGWCGEHFTDDWEYETCMEVAWLNYQRCKNGQPRIDPDPRRYRGPKSPARKPNE
jgi:hypothetical protein